MLLEKKKRIEAKKILHEKKERLDKLKSKSAWLKEAQIIFNRYIRLRDAGQSCISCGRRSGCKVNAGHYLSVGSHPHLRFNEDNCHLQCEYCNTYKSGNQLAYRPRLIAKIGLEKVEKLETDNGILKLTIEDIKVIKHEYSKKVLELKRIQNINDGYSH